MIAKNRAQLKAWIKNMSAKVEVNENIILQNYMLERQRCKNMKIDLDGVVIDSEITFRTYEEIVDID